MHLAFRLDGFSYRASSLWEIGSICNILDRQLLKRFVEEHAFLILTRPKEVEHKYVLGYYIPRWLHGFFCNPRRSQCSYSASWVIAKCFEHAIEEYLRPDSHVYPVIPFFVPARLGRDEISFGDIVVRGIAIDAISDATRFLEHVRYGSDRNDLLRFLGNLSEIHWLNIYSRECPGIDLANDIVHWVCTTLVGRFPVTKFCHLITIETRNRRHHRKLVIFEKPCKRSLLQFFPTASFQPFVNVFCAPANWAFLKITIASGVSLNMYKIFFTGCSTPIALTSSLRSFPSVWVKISSKTSALESLSPHYSEWYGSS